MKRLKRLFSALLAFAVLLSAFGVQAGAAGLTVTGNIAELDLTELDAMIAELDGLAAQCEQRNLSCDYEQVNIAVLKKFAQILAEDKTNNYAEELEFTVNSLNRLYAEAKSGFEGILGGAAAPLGSPRYLTGKRKIEGGSIIAPTTAGDRPYYFIGYGHFGTAANDITVMNSLGASIIQNEMGPDSVIVPRGQGSHADLLEDDAFDVNTAAIYNRIVPTLQKAAANNVCVSLLISPHYFPGFLYELYPDLAFPESGGFIKYHINHPVARRVMETYLRTLIPIVARYDSLFEICLTNEPVYVSSESAYDTPAWREYLKNKYATVGELNETLGTAYAGFEEISMPPSGERSALAREWVLFNNRLFAGWHQWMTGIIKEIAPGVPVSAKVMSYVSYNETSAWRGTDYAQFAEFTDFNGNDTWANVDSKNSTLYSKTAWYDYMGDIKNAPIINSEDHIIGDRSKLYGDDENKLLTSFVGADMWQGAIHGRDANTIWVWERSYDDASDFNGSILHRPECVAAVGRTALDINRLANEVRAFDSAKEDVAILFSDTSRVFDATYTNYLLLACRAASNAGKTFRFVTEDTLGDLEDGMLLLVPNAVWVKRSTLEAVNAYALAGNEVMLLSRCMSMDENGKPQDEALLESLYENSTVVGVNPVWFLAVTLMKLLNGVLRLFTSYQIDATMGVFGWLSLNRNIAGILLALPFLYLNESTLRNRVLEKSPNDVMFKGGLLDNTVADVEWRVTEYNGRLLVNVCSYNDTPVKNVSLVYKGRTLGTLDELIGQRQVSDGFTLEPYEPMLFSIDK